MGKVAIVTGAGRKTGIGYEVAKGLIKNPDFHVIITTRNKETSKEIVDSLQSYPTTKGTVETFVGDLTNEDSIAQLVSLINTKFDGKLDVLVNNAGTIGSGTSFLNVKKEDIISVLDANTLVPLRLCQEFVPMMKKHKYGRIVMVSSGAGQISEMNGGIPQYRISKVSMNALTKIMNDELKDENILVNSVCPGFVKTEFSQFNSKATRTPEEGADSIIWLATLDDNGPRGKFFRDRKELAF